MLSTQHPPLSPLLWTTMMTGTSPLEHEILDFTRFHPATGRKEPITSDERKVPAVWNMATQAGQEHGRVRALGDLSGRAGARPGRLRSLLHFPLLRDGAA